jgi:hypothetical protein
MPPSHGGAAARKSSHRFGSTCTSISAQQQQEPETMSEAGMTRDGRYLNTFVLPPPFFEPTEVAAMMRGNAAVVPHLGVGGISKILERSSRDRADAAVLQHVTKSSKGRFRLLRRISPDAPEIR